MLVFGTRPEAIKMAPLVKEFQKHPESFETIVCVTGQHREMLDQVLKLFEITPDYDLNIMRQGQDLYDVTARVLTGMRDVLREATPDVVLVHGDTTTSTAAALAAFYQQIPVGHIEAGLRTHNIYSPWPEEMNRQVTGRIATYNFAPTRLSKQNLMREDVSPDSILVTGNTVIDALRQVVRKIKTDAELDKELERRGHLFVRYADDLVIFCKSRRSAQRTLDNLLPFIETKLFLKVNKDKTHVAYMRDIKFLSYAFGRRNGKCQFYIHVDSIKKMKIKIRELTSRNNGWSYEYRKQRLTWYIRGWLNYFKFAGLKSRIKEWDGWLRHRIRMCIWKSWKRVRTRYRNLKKLIPDESRVRMAAFCRKKYWRMASHPTVQAALSDERLLRAGYPTFKMYYHPVFKG